MGLVGDVGAVDGVVVVRDGIAAVAESGRWVEELLGKWRLGAALLGCESDCEGCGNDMADMAPTSVPLTGSEDVAEWVCDTDGSGSELVGDESGSDKLGKTRPETAA